MPTVTPLADAVLVNGNVANNQFEPTTRQLVGGAYVIAWIDFSTGQVRFDLAKVVGTTSTTLVNDARADSSAGVKRQPIITDLDDGGFIISWQVGDPPNTQVAFQRFDGLGNKVGSEQVINSPGAEAGPSLAPVGNGWIVGWDTLESGQFTDPGGQLYNVFGDLVGGPITLNTTTAGQQAQINLIPLPGGGFTSYYQSFANAQFTVYAQDFDALGDKVGSEKVVAQLGSAPPSSGDAARLEDGDSVYTYVQSGKVYVVFGLGAPIEVADVPNGIVGEPSIAPIPGNGFVVTWVVNNAVGNDPLMGRAYDANNGPVAFGDPFMITDNARFQIDSGVTVLPEGKILFAWDGAGTGDTQGIFSRLFQIGDFGNVPTPSNDYIYRSGEQPSDDLFVGDDKWFDLFNGNNTVNAGDGNDFMSSGGGNDAMNGDAGNDAVYWGGFFDGFDLGNGGTGVDTAIFQGNYPGLTIGNNLGGFDVLLFGAGRDTRWGDYNNLIYDYNVIYSATPATLTHLEVQAPMLSVNEDLVFNATTSSNVDFRVFAGLGVNAITGGNRNDGTLYGMDGFNGLSLFDGGGGTDTLAFRGNYVGSEAINLAAGNLINTEVVAFLTGLANPFGGRIVAGGFDYEVVLGNGIIAPNQQLDLIGSSLGAGETLDVNASAITDGSLRFIGGGGDDSFLGGANADIVFGGIGADDLDGGPGGDTLVYRSIAESTPLAPDTIDLDPADRIDLSRIDANSNTAANDAFIFVGAQPFSNVAGQLRALGTPGGGVIEADVNGDGVADLRINYEAQNNYVPGGEVFIP